MELETDKPGVTQKMFLANWDYQRKHFQQILQIKALGFVGNKRTDQMFKDWQKTQKKSKWGKTNDNYVEHYRENFSDSYRLDGTSRKARKKRDRSTINDFEVRLNFFPRLM